MAFNVGELAFFLSLDRSQFDRGLDLAGNKTNAFASLAKTAGQTAATMLTGATAGLTAYITKISSAGAQYNILQQNSRAALKTLLGSQEAVNAQMEKLNELASRSPFSKATFIEGQQQLISFGMAAEKVVPTLDAIQNAVAATGGSSQQLSDITFVLAQIQAAGKITGQDLLQLGQRGINAAELIGSQMGMTGQEIKASITKGTLSADDAITALTNGMAAKFGGATTLIKQQWSGAADRIKAAQRDIGARLAEPFIDPNGGGQAVIWGNLVADTMRSVQKHVNTAMDMIEAKAGPVFDKITDVLRRVNVTAQKFNVTGFANQLANLSKYTPLVAGLGTALLTMGAGPIPVIGRLATAIGPLTAGLGSLVATHPGLRKVGDAFVTAFTPALPHLQQAAKLAADLGMKLMDSLAPALQDVAHGAGHFLADLAPLAPMIVQVATSTLPLVEVISQLAGFLANLPTPLLATAAAFLVLRSHSDGINKVMRGIGGKFSDAAAGVGIFIDQAKQTGVVDAASQAVGGFGTVLKGLFSPASLVTGALTILTAVVAHYAQKKAEAAQRVRDYANTLNEETGAITASTRAQVVASTKDTKRLERYEQLGGASKDYVDSIMGETQAQERYQKVIDNTKERMKQLNETIQKGTTRDSFGGTKMTQEAKAASQEYEKLRISLEDVTESHEEQVKGLKDAQASKQKDIELTNQAASAEERHRQALDALIEAKQKEAAANGDLTMANYAVQDAQAAMTKAIEEGAAATRDAAGGIDWNAQATRKLVEAGHELAGSYNTQLEAMVKAGKSQSEIDAQMQANIATIQSWGESLGMSQDEIDEYIKKIGLVPEYKSTTIDMTVESEAAEHKIDDLVAGIQKNQDGVLTIYGDDTEATKTLMDSLGLVETSEGVYSINANDDPALAALLISLGVINTSTGTLTIDGNKDPVISAANQAKSSIDSTTGTVKINGQDYATSAASAIVAQINAMKATIKIEQQVFGRTGVFTGAGSLAYGKKDGGVMEYYANGGLRESHVAQIAPAGAWRVWAEPETGGEGYVPLAPSKRKRSQEVMAEIARRFGDVYIPAGAKAYANGGPSNTGGTGGGVTVYATVVNPFTGEEVQAMVRDESIRVVRETI